MKFYLESFYPTKKSNRFLKIFIFITLISFSILDEMPIDLNKYNPTAIDGIILLMDPFDVSTYIYNQYYPNYTIDYCENGYCIDGELGLPINQSISNKFLFDINNKGTYTQLSYKQKKSDLYFDTKIGLKTDINSLTNFIFKAESKSIVDNINQNYVLNINKVNNNSSLKVGYLYHIEKDPSIDFYQNINQNIESFHLGYIYKIDNGKINIDVSSAFQLSNNERLFDLNNQNENEYIYNSRSIWNSFDMKYDLNQTLEFKAFYNVKDNLINQNTLVNTSMKSHAGIELNYFLNNCTINIGAESLDKDLFPKFILNYYRGPMTVSLIKDSFIARNPIEIDNGLSISYKNINNLRLEFLYDNNKSSNLFRFGKIVLPQNEYFYFTTKSKFRFEYIIFDLQYNYYNSDITYFKESCIYGLTALPPLKTDKYIMYGKIFGSSYKFNRLYDIDLNNINLFTLDSDVETVNDINIASVEFGFIFNSFKISYVKRSPFKEHIEFNNDYLNFLRYDYIDLVWYFKD